MGKEIDMDIDITPLLFNELKDLLKKKGPKLFKRVLRYAESISPTKTFGRLQSLTN